MARRRRRRQGLGAVTGSPEGWLRSAESNFARIRGRKNSRGCRAIGHYTDVIAEASVAARLAPAGSPTEARADKLVRTATHAQNGAIALCRREEG